MVTGAESDTEPSPGPESGGQATARQLEELQRATAQLRTAHARCEQRAAELDRKQADLKDAAARIEQQQARHQEEAAALRERQDEADEAERRLADRQQRLTGREEDARRDFAGYRQEQLTRLGGELEARRATADEQQRQIEAEWESRLRQRERVLLKRAAELDEHGEALSLREQEQQRTDRRLLARQERLNQDVDDRIQERLGQLQADLELARQQAVGYQQQVNALRQLAEQRAGEIAGYEAAATALDGRLGPEVVAELQRLRAENRELREEAAAHPRRDRDQIAELEARCHDLSVDHEELTRQNNELRRHVAAARISATERENARMINEALQRQNDALVSEMGYQTARLEQMQGIVQDAPPFPGCSAMDEDERFQVIPEYGDEVIQLPDFVNRLRSLMAAELGLYYSEADLRCFLAGMAASRLHLLEGISGIGKTRLPEAFAQMIGAGRETVAVAAEWRSPQDLLGYYNPFERRFYESQFTQCLYRAQLPLFRGKPFFVVLDEMNLSHPEQYFSDLLSALERKEANRVDRPLLHLMTAAVSPAPRLLRDGRSLELPDNVWFIGTANQDETTVRFADKTYDRAHVLELPAQPEQFRPVEARPFGPVSQRALGQAFEAARRACGGSADQILEFFDRRLGGILRDGFGVSWGIRLERQARSFAPVTVAAGGAAGEAADHLLATKILRKLTDRFDVAQGDLRDLRREIEARWKPEFGEMVPRRSLRVLDSEIRSAGQV
jgi:AAA domain (dynein-related subfamily)